jgi:signal transduction histidine kinase
MSDREQVQEQTSGRLGNGTGLTCPECGGASVGRVLAQVPIGILTVDADLRVEYLNPAARAYLGGGTVGALLPDPLPHFSLRKFAGRLFGPSPELREIVETSSGRFLEVEGIHAGATSSAVLIVQDVSVRERQRRAERDFVSNAAHELRTPIAAINSAVEVLLGGAEASTADRELFLGHIGRESARLERLAEALLLLARIQTGQEQPTLELVEIAPLLEDVATQLKPSAGVALHVRCGPAVRALADRVLLRQAVWNVAANAARHTRSGSIVLCGRDLGDIAELEVEDTGSGIAPADRERAFERFSRGGRPPGGGAGLGLAIAREIVGALGGSIQLDSELGQGTQVRLHVPSARVIPR